MGVIDIDFCFEPRGEGADDEAVRAESHQLRPGEGIAITVAGDIAAAFEP